MEERQPSNTKIERKREKQPISVPFIWEEKPGTPKKDWKPSAPPIEPVDPPVKLVVSVPFGWEEKPGTPLRSFAQLPPESTILPPQAHTITVPSPPQTPPEMTILSPQAHTITHPSPPQMPLELAILPPQANTTTFPSPQQRSPELTILPPWADTITFPSPPRNSNHYDGNWRLDDSSINDHGNDERDGLSDSELETCSFHTNDSFSSAPSLLANGLISTSALSRAVPVQENSAALKTDDNALLQSPGSPSSDTESTTSSYATGTASLAGASFLEWLFPLLVPNSKFTNKVGCLETETPHTADEQFLHEGNGSQVRRPLLTLGELIVMSRRRSYHRKIVKMQKQTSMDFVKRNAFGCGIFGSANGISELHRKWKRQLQLKLM